MGIRLNKVLTELNIGLQTAVDFLKKKSHLGDIREDATTNTKISDQQYDALVNEFKGDKDVKTQASALFPKKNKEKKTEMAKTKTEEAMAQRQQFKPLGKIDLSTVGKPKPAPAAEPMPQSVKPAEPEAMPVPAAETPVKTESVAQEPAKAEPVAATPVVQEPQEQAPVAPKPEPAAPAHAADAPEAATVPEAPVVATAAPEASPVQPETSPSAKENEAGHSTSNPSPLPSERVGDGAPTAPAEEPAKPSGPTIYTLKSEAKLAPKVNVLGKIDLSALNQSTRPKKKSKEEKR